MLNNVFKASLYLLIIRIFTLLTEMQATSNKNSLIAWIWSLVDEIFGSSFTKAKDIDSKVEEAKAIS